MPYTKNLYSTDAYSFDLPQELIAQFPACPRDSSRLMVIERSTGEISEHIVSDLPLLLQKGDSLVFNDTKVIPARLIGRRPTGGSIEVFLTRQIDMDTWEALVRPGKKASLGTEIVFGDAFSGKIIDVLPTGERKIQFSHNGGFLDQLERYGQMPLPPYIKRKKEVPQDRESYQTVFASVPGAIAAPTAGLHFTQSLLNQLETKEISQTHITLHVGLGTFRPVNSKDIRHHIMHKERVVISPAAAAKLNSRHLHRRQVCVGTTCCRALESASTVDGHIHSGEMDTDIFIYPGYSFKYVRGLLTNFHLPRSTLLMLVCTFGGYDLIMKAYAQAIKHKFRFFSYGDAMLII